MTGVRLHVASAGNEFMQHISGMFAEGFEALQVPCRVVVDGMPLDGASAETLDVVVAPHEFFPLHFLQKRPTIELAPTLEAVAVLNVEQPGSQWFDLACEFARKARMVFDVSAGGVDAFHRRGVPAWHTPLGYVPSLEGDRLRAPDCGLQQAASQRTIDVLFIGASSRRRDSFFARHAAFFESIRAELRLASAERPRHVGTPGYLSGAERKALIESSRIVLGVHSDDRDYFEQHRALLAMANGALLVTEASRHFDPLEAGRHFVMGALDELPGLCRRYLDRPSDLDAIAAAARSFVRTGMSVRRGCQAMLEVAEELKAAGSAAASEKTRRDALRARIKETGERRARGEAIWSESQNTAARTSTETAVSVVITAYNYERFLPRCLDSVADAVPPPGGLEVVVVDDASTDASSAVAEAFMAAAALPMRLVRKHVNTGLSDARNVGFECARGRYVFVLDADNWIFPSCLSALYDALAATGHAAAYGTIAKIDEDTGGGTGLLSARAWDPAALLEAPYIDAMAMLDREIVRGVGGYSTDLLEWGYGWEDYDLWLTLARAGHTCAHVPRLVAAYRDHRMSMLRQTNQRSQELASHFGVKFADLVSRYGPLEKYFAFPATDDAMLTPDEREIRQLRAHLTALETEIAGIHRSKSWQITAPLRAALGWLESRR